VSERLDERNRIKGRQKNLEEIKMNELLNGIPWGGGIMKDINEIMLNPVRMRIIQELAVKQSTTTT
jgi:hypothetical protein